MTSHIGGCRLATAFVRHRRAQAIVLMLLGCTLAASVVGLATMRNSAEQAIADSLRADLGQKNYALQTGNADAIAILRQLRWASPVEDTDGDVSAGELADSVSIRATTDASLPLGVLTAGTRPRRVGDVVLTQSTAKALDIRLGADISVRAGGLRIAGHVVGLSVDPANPSNRTLIALVGESDGFAATRWLSDTDFYAESRLKPFLDRRTASYRSIGPLLEAAAQNRPRFLSAMQFLPAGSGLLMAVVLLSAIVVMTRIWTSYADALIAAGMPAARAWRTLFAIVFGLVTVGEVIGGGTAVAVLSAARLPVSGWFGQHWVTMSVPAPEPIIVIVLTVLAGVLAVQIQRVAPAWASWVTARRLREPAWSTPVAAVLFGMAAAVWAVALHAHARFGTDGSSHETSVVATVVAAVLLAATLPFLVSALIGWGLPPVTRVVLGRVLGGLRPVLAIGAVIVFGSGMWSAQTTYDANTGEAGSSPLEPAGSFVISALPNAAIDSLASTYRARGGRRIDSYQIPDESKVNLRVTSTGLVDCMTQRRMTNPNDAPPECSPQHATSSVNTVLIGAPGSAPRADPNLLANGKVGLLLFPSGSGSVARFAVTGAEPDATLGGNLPGLVVPPDSNVVTQFGLSPGGTSEVLLLDFNRLTPYDRAFVRAAALRLAAGAETADGTDPTAYDRLRSVANTVSILGALAAAIVLLLGGASIVVAHELVRRTLIDLGAAAAPRRRFMARLTTAALLSMVLTIPLAILTACFGALDAIATYGHLWLLPAAAALLAAVGVAVAFRRVPAAAHEGTT